MDNLLNGLFFKCFFCKVLTKIVNRESVSPEHDNINRLLYSNGEQEVDTEIKGLFHPSYNDNNTPMKNIIGGCFNNNVQGIINPNILSNLNSNLDNPVITQNLLKNFNQTVIASDHKNNSSNLSDILQTPKTIYKFERNLLFSPENEHFQTPNLNKTTSDTLINMRNFGMNYHQHNHNAFSTPRNPSKLSAFSNRENVTQSKNIVEEIAIEDFENKLYLQNQRQTSTTSLNNSYTLLASKNRIGRVMEPRMNLTVNKVEQVKSNTISTSEFAGYNKSSSKKGMSKSPLSLRKRNKEKFGLSETNKLNQSIDNTNLFNSSHSFINYQDETRHNKQKFGAGSFLSDIKPVNNYSTNLDTSKFSFTNNLSNLTNH